MFKRSGWPLKQKEPTDKPMLGQFAGLLVSPLMTSLLLGGSGLFLAMFVRSFFWRRFGSVMGGFSIVWLWLWSMPVMSDVLRGRIEALAGSRSIGQVSVSGVIVVLGGGVNGTCLPLRYYPDLGSASDRVWHAARLYKAGKGKMIVLSGGFVSNGNESEAEAMQSFLLDLGVPKGAIILEDASTNTSENARLTHERFAKVGIEKIILVTSALHMPRARRLFEHEGFQVIPAPADFEVIDHPFEVTRFLPEARALEGSARAMKELVGLVLIY